MAKPNIENDYEVGSCAATDHGVWMNRMTIMFFGSSRKNENRHPERQSHYYIYIYQ